MFFIVGLGNPGAKYAGTRHNVGFEVIDLLCERQRLPSPKEQLGAEVVRGRVSGHEVVLIKPQTFMNLSGDAVGALVRYYKGSVGDVVVVHDELDFEPGVVRIKVGGGHAGHNGLKSIMGHLGRDFVRVRIGVGKPPKGWQGADWVLTKLDAGTREVLGRAGDEAAEAVETIVAEGVQTAMARANQRRPDAKEDGAEEST